MLNEKSFRSIQLQKAEAEWQTEYSKIERDPKTYGARLAFILKLCKTQKQNKHEIHTNSHSLRPVCARSWKRQHTSTARSKFNVKIISESEDNLMKS